MVRTENLLKYNSITSAENFHSSGNEGGWGLFTRNDELSTNTYLFSFFLWYIWILHMCRKFQSLQEY